MTVSGNRILSDAALELEEPAPRRRGPSMESKTDDGPTYTSLNDDEEAPRDKASDGRDDAEAARDEADAAAAGALLLGKEYAHLLDRDEPISIRI